MAKYAIALERFTALREEVWRLIMKLGWLGNLLGVGIVGFGIGWLLGMAVSPVIANVVVTIIGAGAALVAIMGGWRRRDEESTANQPDAKTQETTQSSLQQLTSQLR